MWRLARHMNPYPLCAPLADTRERMFAFMFRRTIGWNTIRQCNVPGNGILLRAACAQVLPMANVAQEAVCWTTTVDSTGRAVSGRHNLRPTLSRGVTPAEQCILVADRDRCLKLHGE
jgi:hypothetical protein